MGNVLHLLIFFSESSLLKVRPFAHFLRRFLDPTCSFSLEKLGADMPLIIFTGNKMETD
jgi:hypothetical protein